MERISDVSDGLLPQIVERRDARGRSSRAASDGRQNTGRGRGIPGAAGRPGRRLHGGKGVVRPDFGRSHRSSVTASVDLCSARDTMVGRTDQSERGPQVVPIRATPLVHVRFVQIVRQLSKRQRLARQRSSAAEEPPMKPMTYSSSKHRPRQLATRCRDTVAPCWSPPSRGRRAPHPNTIAGQQTPQDLVDALHAAFGEHHARAVHAKGILLEGSFTPAKAARALSRSPIFEGAPPAGDCPILRLHRHPGHSRHGR